MAALVTHTIEQGLAYGIAALGLFLTYRILEFPDLTVDGSFVTGAAIASVLLVRYGFDPFTVLLMAFVAGGIAGLITGLLNTCLGITNLLAGVLTMIRPYSINLRIMGRPNLSLLRVPTATRGVARHGRRSDLSPFWRSSGFSPWRSSSFWTGSSARRLDSRSEPPGTANR